MLGESKSCLAENYFLMCLPELFWKRTKTFSFDFEPSAATDADAFCTKIKQLQKLCFLRRGIRKKLLRESEGSVTSVGSHWRNKLIKLDEIVTRAHWAPESY